MHENWEVKIHCLMPHLKKWGSIDSLNPVLLRSMMGAGDKVKLFYSGQMTFLSAN